MRKIIILIFALISCSAFAVTTPNSGLAKQQDQQAFYQGVQGVVDNSVSSPTCKSKACNDAYLNGVQNEIDQESQDRLD